MNAIEVTNLTRDYNGLRAVDHINFTVTAGEIFGFLGPNGAGKTTTIKMLTGQLRPTEGGARVAGCDVVTERENLLPQIGVVFDNQNLYERFTARENLMFYARLYGMPKTRVDELLHTVGLGDETRKRVKKYSNGMKQRLLIARALLHQPAIIFMDEPSRGLDPHAARAIRSTISELARSGITIFLCTHYMDEADRLCDRVAILESGRIAVIDTPEALKAASTTPNATLEDVFIERTGKELIQ